MAHPSKRHIRTDAPSGTDPRTTHPMRIMLWFALSGITVLFVGLLVSFLLAGGVHLEGFHLPKAFLVSTALLAVCSVALVRASVAFRQEQRHTFRWMMIAALATGFAFLAAQSLGWAALHSSGIDLHTHVGGSYLYLISAMHGVHVLAGLAFLGLYAAQALRSTAHPAIALFFFTDPDKRTQLGLLGLYWHFMAGIWGGLMGVFLWVTV